MKKSKCPICKQLVLADNCGFDRSVYKFKGFSFDSGAKNVCGRTVDGQFTTFNEAGGGSSLEQYQELELTVDPPRKFDIYLVDFSLFDLYDQLNNLKID